MSSCQYDNLIIPVHHELDIQGCIKLVVTGKLFFFSSFSNLLVCFLEFGLCIEDTQWYTLRASTVGVTCLQSCLLVSLIDPGTLRFSNL